MNPNEMKIKWTDILLLPIGTLLFFVTWIWYLIERIRKPKRNLKEQFQSELKDYLKRN